MKKVYVVKQLKGISCRTFHSIMKVSKEDAALIKKHEKDMEMTNIERGRYDKLLDRLGEQFFESNYKEDQSADWEEGMTDQLVSIALIKGGEEGNKGILEKRLKKRKRELKKLAKERTRKEALSEGLEIADSDEKAGASIEEGRKWEENLRVYAS